MLGGSIDVLETRSRTLARTAHHGGKGAWDSRSLTSGHLLVQLRKSGEGSKLDGPS